MILKETEWIPAFAGMTGVYGIMTEHDRNQAATGSNGLMLIFRPSDEK